MGELATLPNIGKEIEGQLMDVGIETAQQLRETGSREAWLRIRAKDPSACYNRLCGLEGAIQGIRWHSLDQGSKDELKAFYESHKVGKT